MRLRIKTWLPVVAGALTLGAVGSESAAQCTSGCQPPPPPCCQPPPPPPPPPTGCCQPPPPPTYPGSGFNGNFNVNVNVNANANANANANSNLIRARGGGNVYVGGGGGAYFSVDQPYPTVIQGLNVEGGMQVVEQAVQRSRWAFERVVIQALCIDDRNIPHPASQVQPGREIAQGYNGELYRCIAGARLQFTIADFAEQISFEGGQTVICQKGESLWYSDGPAEAAAAYAAEFGDGGPGQPLGGGIVECRPQLAERDCNERSLLRRYGAGLKVLTLWREEIYTAYEQHTVAASAVIVGQSLSLDGGVGGRVF